MQISMLFGLLETKNVFLHIHVQEIKFYQLHNFIKNLINSMQEIQYCLKWSTFNITLG